MAFLQVLREKELAGRKQTDGIEILTASDPCKTSNAIQKQCKKQLPALVESLGIGNFGTTIAYSMESL